MPRQKGLHVVERKVGDKTYKEIRGTVYDLDGNLVASIRQAPRTSDPEREAKKLEGELLNRAWHGERKGAIPFAQAVESYFLADTRSPDTKARLLRVLEALGDIPLAAVNLDLLNRAIPKIESLSKRKNGPIKWTPATINRSVLTPVSAVMNFAADQGWCERIKLKHRKEESGRTKFLYPDQAQRFLDASAPHFRDIAFFVLCTGARQQEVIGVEFGDIMWNAAKVKFWKTKNGQRQSPAPDRVASLPPAAVAMLKRMQVERFGNGPIDLKQQVFCYRKGSVVRPYTRKGGLGSLFITAKDNALRRAGLDPEFNFHDLRHTWATWYYRVHDRDLMALKTEGRWATIEMLERYTHLMDAGSEDAIRAMWGYAGNPRAKTATHNGKRLI